MDLLLLRRCPYNVGDALEEGLVLIERHNDEKLREERYVFYEKREKQDRLCILARVVAPRVFYGFLEIGDALHNDGDVLYFFKFTIETEYFQKVGVCVLVA